MDEDNLQSDYSDYVYESDSGVDEDGAVQSAPQLAPEVMEVSSIPNRRRSCPWSKEYFYLMNTELKDHTAKELEKVSSMLGVDSFRARLLLMHFNWDSERVMNEFLARDGLDKVLEMAGGPPCCDEGDGAAEPACKVPKSDSITCQVCLSEVSNNFETNWCGHSFCNECWGGYLSVQIAEGKSGRLRCMSFKCNVVCEARIVESLCSKEDYQKYEQAQLNSFVDDNPRANWCRSVPHCGRFIELLPSAPRCLEPECICGQIFCFKCGKEAHAPVPCDWYSEWSSKCQADSATAKFITSNCKPCPKCHKTIQKVSGCNHVRCVCGQCMCWLCGASVGVAHGWDSIEGHTCGSYRSELEKNAVDARKELERYMHYYTRYEAHMDSLKVASTLRATVSRTIDTLEDLGAKSEAMSEAAPHADWLLIGLEQLLRMRQVLAFSFVFGFYAFHGHTQEMLLASQKKRGFKDYHIQELFEGIQSRLEFSVEKLSELVEKPAAEMTADIKAQVLQFANVTHVNCNAMYSVIFAEIVSTGAIASPIAPYRPLRLMVTGLGTSIEVGVENADSHTEQMPTILPNPPS